ncbi:MAG: hypothetical protein C4344_04345, partial [Acidimicrobiia bacterium]
MAADEFARLDATGLAALIRSGELTPAEAVEAAIGRIEALDGTLNAVVHRSFDTAMDAARDPRLPDGPFRGVLFLVKDLWAASAVIPCTWVCVRSSRPA